MARRPFWTRRNVGFGLVGVGAVVGAGLGVPLGLLASARVRDSDAACPIYDGERRCSQAGVDAMHGARGFAWGSDVAVAAGAASAIVGTYLILSSRGAPPATLGTTPSSPASSSITSLRPSLTASTAPGGGGRVFGGVDGRF